MASSKSDDDSDDFDDVEIEDDVCEVFCEEEIELDQMEEEDDDPDDIRVENEDSGEFMTGNEEEESEDGPIIEVVKEGDGAAEKISIFDMKKLHYQKIVQGATIGGYRLMREMDNPRIVKNVIVSDGVTNYGTKFVFCGLCKTVYSRGGGAVTPHVRKCLEMKREEDEKNHKKNQLSPKTVVEEKRILTGLISEFIVASGSAILLVDSLPFQKLLRGVVNIHSYMTKDHFNIIMPKRKVIRESMQKNVEMCMKLVYARIKPKIINKFASFSADFGRNHHDFFCLKVSYIETIVDKKTGDKSWKLIILPLAINVCNESSKNSDLVAKLCLQEIQKMNDLDVDLSDFLFTADGAAYMRKCGDSHFLKYVRCSAHLSNILAQHTINPYANSGLPQYVLDHLKKIESIITDCNNLVKKIKNRFSIKMLLPHRVDNYVETRWLSNLMVLRSISKNIDALAKHKDSFDEQGKQLILKLISNTPMIENTIETLAEFDEICIYFQQDDVTIHAVLPTMIGLIIHFQRKAQLLDDTTRCLGESAVNSLLHNIQDISEFHCLAYLLDPQRVEVQENINSLNIQLDVEKEAKKALQKISQILNLEPTKTPTKPRASNENGLMAKFLKREEQTETLEDEFQIFLATKSRLSLHHFWPQNMTTFPKLTLVAKKLFGAVASEASTERSFSLLKNTYRNNRRRLKTTFLEKLLVAHEIEKSTKC
ncbi:unnamed protein product [Caenorhabditis angaria]|uniref:HAT C-terminal dimerisation domain-containing protein n=1 Tax=Caenorhabditis angaria TaxID=860376 RepID=A0A9P1IS42_9PELO|nr:unnamed protein product [Caenorhabditis angaria]